MAQRTIHLLLGKIMLEQVKIKNPDRFLLGNVLPDAIESLSLRNTSHFIKELEQEDKWYFDLYGFREQYGDLMVVDDLYLGYYMHLVEDTLYRKFLYRDYQFASHFKTEEEIRTLHNDYRLLNMHIVKRYGLKNEVERPMDFEIERINEVVPFCLDDFLKEMSKDFLPFDNGTTTALLTEDLLDEFIEKYANLCVEEYEAVKNGKEYLQLKDYKWDV